MRQRNYLLIPIALVWVLCNCAAADVRLLPGKLVLDGVEARHVILAEQFDGDVATGIAANDVRLQSSDENIVRIDGGTVVPVSDGKATISAVRSGKSLATAEVVVRNTSVPFEWSFRNHVQAVLAKQGCNSGACHGALAGKGGFRLSLRGYDADRDHFNITRQQRGRRVDLTAPEVSLLLTKPTTAVPHKGGMRLEENSIHYRVIAEWLAAGAAAPAEDDVRLTSLRILPERTMLKKGTQQPLLVQAEYSDGRIEDVTHWAKFTSANESVATIDDAGVVSVIGPGEGAVTAWFGSRIVVSRITAPYAQEISPAVFVHSARRNFIDDLVLGQLRRLNLQPTDRCSDEVFIRRAYLDTIGTLPTAMETREFLTNQSPTKRDDLIDSLLQRDEFADYWAYRWSDVMMINGTLLRPDAVKAYYQWIHANVKQNTPWDEFVRQVVTAKGSSIENGATNFYALHQAPEDMAENVSQAFLGLSIGCAKCHNHPLEKWTNDQYYGFANLFSRVRAKGWGGDPRNGDGKRTLVTVSTGELIQPRTGKPQPPTPLDAEPVAEDDAADRREVLADWLVASDNELFSRSITNRIWKNYFGVGLVEQVDDMRSSNPASNEELLTAASQYLVDQDFNLKALMRQILQSETYQRDSRPQAGNAKDSRNYSRYYPRRLMAEVLLDAVSHVTDVPTDFNKVLFPGNDIRDTDFYPAGTRAIQLYDSAVQSYFLQTFGRNQRRITCECERSDEPSMVQVLHISNGETINGKLSADGNRIARWLEKFADERGELVDEIFLTTLSRFPSDHEKTEIVKLLESTPAAEQRVVLEDVVWGILSTREFLFNH